MLLCSIEKYLSCTCLNSAVSPCAASELQSFIPHSPILIFILSSSLPYSNLLQRLITADSKELLAYTTPSLSPLASHATIGITKYSVAPATQLLTLSNLVHFKLHNRICKFLCNNMHYLAIVASDSQGRRFIIGKVNVLFTN